jgi:hypothetical protein
MTSLPSHVGNAIRTSALGSGDQEIPRAQLRAIKPTLERIFAKDTDTGSGRSVPGTWVSAARDCRAFGGPLRDGEPKAQEIRA